MGSSDLLSADGEHQRGAGGGLRDVANGVEADAARITPPLILSFDASSVPVLQLALSSDQLSETTLFDDATSFIRPQLASVAGAAIPLPYGGKVRQVQADLNQQALHTYGISAK